MEIPRSALDAASPPTETRRQVIVPHSRRTGIDSPATRTTSPATSTPGPGVETRGPGIEPGGSGIEISARGGRNTKASRGDLRSGTESPRSSGCDLRSSTGSERPSRCGRRSGRGDPRSGTESPQSSRCDPRASTRSERSSSEDPDPPRRPREIPQANRRRTPANRCLGLPSGRRRFTKRSRLQLPPDRASWRRSTLLT
jgi:hypothetical protein